MRLCWIKNEEGTKIHELKQVHGFDNSWKFPMLCKERKKKMNGVNALSI